MKKFWAGFLLHSAMLSLYQDIIGKANYMAAMNHLWMSAWITVPLALLTIFIAFCLLVWEDL